MKIRWLLSMDKNRPKNAYKMIKNCQIALFPYLLTSRIPNVNEQNERSLFKRPDREMGGETIDKYIKDTKWLSLCLLYICMRS